MIPTCQANLSTSTPPHHLTLLDLLGKSAQPTPTWEPGWGDLRRLANLATRTCARCGLVWCQTQPTYQVGSKPLWKEAVNSGRKLAGIGRFACRFRDPLFLGSDWGVGLG